MVFNLPKCNFEENKAILEALVQSWFHFFGDFTIRHKNSIRFEVILMRVLILFCKPLDNLRMSTKSNIC